MILSKRNIFVVFLLVSFAAVAGRGPQYRYGECWWREYTWDEGTDLLLHFGKPQVSARQKLSAKVQKKKSEEVTEDDLLGVDDDSVPGMDNMRLKVAESGVQAPVIKDDNVPADVVQDYCRPRHRPKLGPGMKKVAGGYYGQGLQCTGKGGFTVDLNAPKSVECWFKVDALPAAEQCLLSVAQDESRLLLRPDGKLEFRLKKPHGNVGTNPNLKDKMSPAQIEQILAKPADIVSPEPIKVGEWTHVCIWSKPHPTPGGGEPWDAQLKVNGDDVAFYLSERFNQYRFFGWKHSTLTIGSNAAGKQAFVGMIDEVRCLTQTRTFYTRPPMPFIDPAGKRQLQFGKPWFRVDSTVFHASLDRGTKLDLDQAGAGKVGLKLLAGKVEGLQVPGVRGNGWVLDPDIGFPRFSLKGIKANAGALEFWLRPVNWDDCTGYWHHSPPKEKSLSIARFYGRDKTDGKVKAYMWFNLDRAHNNERGRLPLSPGRWYHVVLNWHGFNRWAGVTIHTGEKRPKTFGCRRDEKVIRNIEPLYVEFGITNKIKPKWGSRAMIEIDEVVGYHTRLAKDEIEQAYKRWQTTLEPIPLYNAGFSFKWSLQRLDFTFTPMLPAGVEAESATVALHNLDQGGKMVLGPFKMTIEQPWKTVTDKKTRKSKRVEAGLPRGRVVMNDGKTLPYAEYEFRFTAFDAAGKAVLRSKKHWDYEEEPWRHCKAGILSETPPPWTPIKASRTSLETRLTRYTLNGNGLPQEILADGVNILAAPFQFLEDGRPMTATGYRMGASKNVEVDWTSTFKGKTCDIEMHCHAEYDGMIKYTLRLKPKGKVAPIAFVMPVKETHAKRYIFYPMGARGVSTGEVGKGKEILNSKISFRALWRDYRKARRRDKKLKWQDFLAAKKKGVRRYGFYGHVDINDMNRGLWWFCDNAAGWHQSKGVGAIKIERRNGGVALVLNLIAESVEYKDTKPIVFAVLPHPARPLPKAYRKYERISKDKDPRNCIIYDAFRPWPQSPRAGGASLNMKLFPASDPKKPEDGPSWDYAESCIPNMKATMPHGLRTLYLSKAWFSCRAGRYDGWEWRSGGGAVSLTPWFVNYLCWEMNEWIGRGIWDAIYLDECYEHPARNLLAGFSVRLPDGSEQPGVTNFQFRELMKRWRNIFHQHGKEPVVIAHHTYSWQYHGLVFTDSHLDGENAPIVSLTSRDWIDSTSKHRYECLQNSRLWGISSFYMPFISEGGFHNKGFNRYPRWQWRMARQAQSQFAHYEVATVYEGQGAQVYNKFWGDVLAWGGADPDKATFHPYWDNAEYIDVEDQGNNTLVSFYKQKGKILLIASNRRRQDYDVKVKLDLKALGLRAKPTLKVLDSSYPPVKGPDQLSKDDLAALKQKAAESIERNAETGGDLDLDEEMALDEIDEVFEDEKKQAKKAASKPTIEGNVVILPCRPKDFRMVAIE